MKNYHDNCPQLCLFVIMLAIAFSSLQLQSSDHVEKHHPLVSSIECKDLDLSSVIICDSVQLQPIDHIKKQAPYLEPIEPNNPYVSNLSDDYISTLAKNYAERLRIISCLNKRFGPENPAELEDLIFACDYLSTLDYTMSVRACANSLVTLVKQRVPSFHPHAAYRIYSALLKMRHLSTNNKQEIESLRDALHRVVL